MKDINEYLDAKAVIIIVIFFVAALTLFSCYQQWNSLQAQIEVASAELEKNSALQSELNRLRQQLREITDSDLEEEMMARMPSQPDETGLILAINTAIEGSKAVVDIQFRERLTNNKYIEMPITIQISTDYRTLVEVLHNLQNSERYIQLRGLTISATGELNKLSVVVDASAFSYVS